MRFSNAEDEAMYRSDLSKATMVFVGNGTGILVGGVVYPLSDHMRIDMVAVMVAMLNEAKNDQP